MEKNTKREQKDKKKEALKATCQLFLIFNGVFIVLLLLGLGISELVYHHIKWVAVLKITIASEILMLLLSLFGGIQEFLGEADQEDLSKNGDILYYMMRGIDTDLSKIRWDKPGTIALVEYAEMIMSHYGEVLDENSQVLALGL